MALTPFNGELDSPAGLQPFAGNLDGESKDQDSALVRGTKNAWNSIKTGGALLTGDADLASQLAAERDAYRKANPGTKEGNELMKAWESGDGISGGISNVVGEMAKDWREAPGVMAGIRETGKNLSAMGGGIVEQIPNMVAPMGGMLAGGAAGSIAGPVGTVGGAWAGATAGNTLVESGEQVDRALMAAGINPQDKAAVRDFLAKNGDTILGQAGTKGAIIGAVDTATLGLGGALLRAPAKAAIERAIASGINPTDNLAIQAAVKADPIYQATQKGASALGRNATVAGLEPAGEFTGEYLGQGVATGDWDTKGAALEALSSLGQSGITFAGQKIYDAATSPLRKSAPGDQAPTTATPEDTAQMDALNADLGGAVFNNETLVPSEQKMLPPGVITVPNNAGGETVIDSSSGPISGAAVTAVTNSTIAEDVASGMPLKGYSPEQAKAELAARPDAERFEIRPHPVSGDRGRVAIVPKSAQALAEIDAKASAGNEAMVRNEQLAAEEDSRKQSAQTAKDVQSLQKQVIDMHRSAAAIEKSITPNTSPQDAAIAREQAADLRTQAKTLNEQIKEIANASQVATTGGQGSGGVAGGSAGNTSTVGGVAGGRGGPAGASISGRGADLSLGDASVSDAALDELSPAPVQPVSSMPGVVQRNQQKAEQARLAAEARGATLIDEEASAAHPSPSEAQIAAGNYKKGHVKVGPIDISVENPIGSTRTGKEGKKSWSTTMQAHYGYVKRTVGADGDQVDVFIKANTANDHGGPVYVIDQFNPKTGRFDEHKAMIGYGSAAEASAAYDAHFSDKSGPKRRKSVLAMTPTAFNEWAKNGDTSSPLSQASKEADAAQAEIAQSTGKLSPRRAGESQNDYEYRMASEKNAAKAQRQQQSEPVSEDQDVEAVRRAIGDSEAEVSVVSEDAMPDMDKAGKGKVSKQSATFMRHVAKMFGKEVVFVKGMEADGFYQKGNKIYLSDQSSVHHLRVLGHEMLHALKRQNRAAYDKLIESVGAIATDAQLNGQFKNYYALDAEMSQKTDAEISEWLADPKNREMILEEMMADLSGNRWAESSFWESVFTKIDAKYGSEQAKGIIAKLRLALVNALNKLMSLVKGGQFQVDARVAEHLESIREALATGFADYAKAVKDKQISEDGVGEAKLSKSKPTMFSDIKRGQKIEQAEPLSEKQWAQVREIALDELSKKDGQRAIDAERDYLANEALANRDSERYKEVAREKLGSMAVPQLSTVPVMEGKVRPTIVGTGKNNNTRVFDVARVMRKRILARAADISNPEGRERIARALVHEALYSLSMDGHAVGWYDRKVREALAVTAMAHPEILTNKEANLAFRIIAAVTSNGQAVRDNFILANEIYKIWRSTGQFPVEFDGGGTRAPAMKAAFAKMNIMVGNHGWEKTQRELMTMRSVREIEQGFDLKINGELMDAMVPTAVGLGGPKIGNFFANLSGYFDSPTMDLWFMRTIGRMTGGIIATKPGLVKHLDKLLSILPESGEVKGVSVAKMRKEIAEYKALSDEQRLDPEITIKVLGQVEKYGRAQYAEFAAPDADGKTFTKKTPENENARALKSNLSALVEAPSSGTQRDQLRQVVNRALTMLDKNGIKLNAADLQAVLWYYEKNLYAKLGDVSESAKPWDYASAARFGVGREYGLVDVGSSKRAGQVRDGQSGVREDGAGGMDEADGEVDARLSKARINFEVAPNPDDVALTSAWNDLSESKRHQLSVSIATDIANRAMRLFGVTGTIKEQQGGFEEETNTSFQLILDQPEKTGEIQNFIGYALSQKSMVAVSEESFPGSEKTGVVTVSIGNADPQAIYRQLRGIKVDGNQPVSGHSTAAGKMAILNYSDVSTEELARLIDSELRGKFYLHIDEVYTSFPEADKTEDYGYGNNRQAREAAAGRPSLQGDADNLRRAATELIRKELKLSSARSDAAGNERVGGRDAADGIAIYGQTSPGSVAAQGFHYSGAERKQLDGRYYGTGAKGREADRVFAAADKRLRERIYFYVDAGKGITPEQGVGAHGHTVNLNNLYDPDRDTFVQAKIARGLDNEAWLNAFESAVIDSGFDGYIRDFGTQRAVVLIGRHSVPVTYTGTGKQTGAVNAETTQKPARRTDLPLGKMTGAEWKKLEPRATDLEDGKMYYRDEIKYSPPRWYFSPLEKAFESAPDKVFGQAAQVKLWLAGNKSKLGLKDDEIFWTGINDWLDMQGKQKVSKADVLGYLAGNGVQVEEIQNTSEYGFDPDEPQLPLGNELDVGIDYGESKYAYAVTTKDGEVIGRGDTEQDAIYDAHSGYPEYWDEGGATQHHKWQLPGGDNYRELLLTLPGQHKYQAPSTHWPGKMGRNVLAHIRMNDRVDSTGAKTLFIEEVQGDWQQEYRKQVGEINKAVDNDFLKIVERMKKDGVLEVECD